MLFAIWLALGLLVGTLGTLIGAGGGFLLMPALLVVYENQSPDVLAAWSLSIILLNALSGSIAYARIGQIDYRSGLIFSMAAIPGAWLGARLTALLPPHRFALIFGLLLLSVSTFLAFRSVLRIGQPVVGGIPKTNRQLATGALMSLFVGTVANIFGIGGGVLHVPLLVYVIGFPTHSATATSHFVLAITTLIGVLTHILSDNFVYSYIPLIPLAIGVIAGAQVGAHYSRRVHGPWILRLLALGLFAVAVRLMASR